MSHSDLEQALGKREIARQLALEMLNSTQRRLVEEHLARYSTAIASLEKKYGGADKIPPQAEDALSTSLFSEFPGTFEAMDAFAKLEDRVLETGKG